MDDEKINEMNDLECRSKGSCLVWDPLGRRKIRIGRQVDRSAILGVNTILLRVRKVVSG